MSRNYKKFKKELFEKNIGLKKEFELLKITKNIQNEIVTNTKYKMLSKKKLSAKSRVKKSVISKFEKEGKDIKLGDLIKIAWMLNLNVKLEENSNIIDEKKEKFIFVDGENFEVTKEKLPIKEDFHYYIYLNKIVDNNYVINKKYIKKLKKKQNVTIKYINSKGKNLMDILIEMDISCLFSNYKNKAEIAIISSDRGFDNYIRNFNILTGDNIILRRINRTANLYEKLEESAEEDIQIEKMAERTLELLKKNTVNLPKDTVSLKNLIRSTRTIQEEDIDIEKVINYLEERKYICIESGNEVEKSKVFYRLY